MTRAVEIKHGLTRTVEIKHLLSQLLLSYLWLFFWKYNIFKYGWKLSVLEIIKVVNEQYHESYHFVIINFGKQISWKLSIKLENHTFGKSSNFLTVIWCWQVPFNMQLWKSQTFKTVNWFLPFKGTSSKIFCIFENCH